MSRILLNFGLFQAGWFACVLGAAWNFPWLGPVVVVMAVAVHLALASSALREAQLIGACALLGLLFDTALLQTGWVSYPNGFWLNGLAPYWMVALWVLFATTLNVSLRWLRHRFWLAGLLGAIGGPASYLAGQGLGGMTLIQPVPALTALAIGWGLVMPALFRIAQRLDGCATHAGPEYIHDSWRKQEIGNHG